MALDAFLKINGIKGSARQKGREDEITVRGFRHTVGSVPDDKGYPSDDSRAGYLVVQKDFDIATPLLQSHLAENKKISEATLRFFRMAPSGGGEENHLSIVMTGVHIASISAAMLYNRRQEDSLIPEIEEVAFTYETIAFAFSSGGRDGGTESRVSSNSGTLAYDGFDALSDSLGGIIKASVADGAKSLSEKIAPMLKDRLEKTDGGAGG
jgi:type VI secretion system Hcp family effector